MSQLDAWFKRKIKWHKVEKVNAPPERESVPGTAEGAHVEQLRAAYLARLKRVFVHFFGTELPAHDLERLTGRFANHIRAQFMERRLSHQLAREIEVALLAHITGLREHLLELEMEVRELQRLSADRRIFSARARHLARHSKSEKSRRKTPT